MLLIGSTKEFTMRKLEFHRQKIFGCKLIRKENYDSQNLLGKVEDLNKELQDEVIVD